MKELQDGQNDDRTIGVLQTVAGKFGTPCYAYFMDAVRQRIQLLRNSFSDRFRIRYAVKSNPNPSLLNCLRTCVDSLDVSSIGEARLALENGWTPQRLSFTGPAKSNDELVEAVACGIGELVIESVAEARRISCIAGSTGRRQKALVRISPAKLPRGFGVRLAGRPTQFGIDEEEMQQSLAEILTLPHLQVSGMHCFGGSQCLDPKSIAASYEIYAEIFRRYAASFDLHPRTLVFGSGMGIASHQGDASLDLGELAKKTNPQLDELKKEPRFMHTELVLELGRYLVAEAGFFLTRVVRIKSSRGLLIGICDGGMNQHLAASGQFGSVLPRNYRMTKISRSPSETGVTCDLVGPLCTSIDRLAQAIELPGLAIGDVIAVHASGAYGLSASPLHFIGHQPAREIMIERVEGRLTLSDVSQFRNRIPEKISIEETAPEVGQRNAG